MLFSRSVAPLAGFASLAYATSNRLAVRDECPTGQEVTMIYTQTFVFVYPVIVDQYCPSTTVLTLDCGVTVNITNAPTHLSTTVFATGTSSLAATIPYSSGSVGYLDAAASSAFSRQVSSIMSSHTSSPSTISVPISGLPSLNTSGTASYTNSTRSITSTAAYTNSTGIALNNTTHTSSPSTISVPLSGLPGLNTAGTASYENSTRTVTSTAAHTNSTGIVLNSTTSTLNTTYPLNTTSTPGNNFVPTNTSLAISATSTSLPLDATTAIACLSVITASYTTTQTPSAITTFITKLENVTAYSTQTVFTTIFFDTTLTDVSSTTTTSTTTDVSSEVLRITVPYTSTTIVPETSIISTETQVSTVTSTITDYATLAARAQETSIPYCSNASVSSITITELAPTPTHTVTQIQNVTTSVFDTSSISALTTLVDSTTQYYTATVTETISTASMVIEYDTVTALYTSTSVFFQRTTTTATVTNTVETAVPQFYIQLTSTEASRSGHYLFYSGAGNSAQSGYMNSLAPKLTAGLCSLTSNGNLICAGRVAEQRPSELYIGMNDAASESDGSFSRLVCSIDAESKFTCASNIGNSVFQQCSSDFIYYTPSLGSGCTEITLTAIPA